MVSNSVRIPQIYTFEILFLGLLILDYNSETVVVVGIKCSNGNSFPKSIMLDKSTIVDHCIRKLNLTLSARPFFNRLLQL